MLSQNVDLKNVNVSSYIQELVRDLTESINIDKSEIEIQLELEEIRLDMDVLIPFALILNELITNAFKYAFANIKKGKLKIALHTSDTEKIELIVEDNGTGLPRGFKIDEQDTLGMKIIQSLIDQIDGKLSYKTEKQKGTEFKLLINRRRIIK
jgi:two-component sensor histidine kinase